MSTNVELRANREATVRAHQEAEARGDVDGAVATFARPRYEVVPTGETIDGEANVHAFLAETVRAFSDFHFETRQLHHTDDAVIAEVTFVGTHDGPWRGLPATHRNVRYRMCNVFVFEGDGLVCERLYFDLNTLMQQLGIAHDPNTLRGRAAAFLNHPMTFVRAALRRR